MTLSNKTIILGISGGIAAYKTVDLVSNLKKLGANVHVIATQNALKFVSPLSLETMSANKVIFTENRSQYSADIEHIKLADQADLILIAPATANCIAKLAVGIADEILYDIVLASRCPIVIAPAMNTNMWQHVTVKNNLDTLINKLNYQIIDPEFGELACGYVGEGRLADINYIIAKVCSIVSDQVIRLPRPANAGLAMTEGLRAGCKIVITMGPTREYLDPVRYITNRSSGKMGFALAKAALGQGYSVDLISSIPAPEDLVKQLKYIPFQTHTELQQAIDQSFKNADALIMAAAVVDYRPKIISTEKLKKQDDLILDLEATDDIVARVAEQKRTDQIVIGFSVETSDYLAKAVKKLERKKLDLIIVNSTDAFDADLARVDIIAAERYHSLLEPISNITLETKDNIALRVLDSFNKIKALQNKDLQIII